MLNKQSEVWLDVTKLNMHNIIVNKKIRKSTYETVGSHMVLQFLLHRLQLSGRRDLKNRCMPT